MTNPHNFLRVRVDAERTVGLLITSRAITGGVQEKPGRGVGSSSRRARAAENLEDPLRNLLTDVSNDLFEELPDGGDEIVPPFVVDTLQTAGQRIACAGRCWTYCRTAPRQPRNCKGQTETAAQINLTTPSPRDRDSQRSR